MCTVRRLPAFLAAMAALCCMDGLAREFPNRPVRIVLPAAPGGAYDVLLRGRGINNFLIRRWGHQIVVDNRAGGGGIIGTEIVARAVPDGHTLLLVTTGFVTNPFLRRQLPYRTPADFSPITVLGAAPNVLVAHPSLAASSAKEFIALARDPNSKLTYASSGTGSGGHLSVELLNRMTGIDVLHVPYKSAGPAVTDLIAGHVQLLITATASAIPHIKTAWLRALAVTSPRRTSVLPDVPTLAESGAAGYAVEGWYGILGPRGIPSATVAALHRDLKAAVSDADVIAHFNAYGFETGGMPPEEFGRYLSGEMKRWGELIHQLGIKADGQ